MNDRVVERFSDEERQLLVTLVLQHWVKLRDDPALDAAKAEKLARIIARMGGTDTVLLADRAYPSGG